METEGQLARGQRRELAMIAVPMLLAVAVAIWFASRFVEPAPPKTIVITTGGESGAYYGFGRLYADALARSGIRLEVRTSAGSIENVARLQDQRSGVSVGLVQGGIANARSAPGLVSIGRMFLEPLWIFHRGPAGADRLIDLKGKRIAVGPEGSGTRHLVDALLKPNEIGPESTELLPLGGRAAADALIAGQVDAIFLALAPEAAVVQELLRRPDIQLMSLAQAEAYSRLFPYLSRTVLPQGAIDLVRNIPSRDVQLLAPVAALVAREEIHPALVTLLVEAAGEVHAALACSTSSPSFPAPPIPSSQCRPTRCASTRTARRS